MELTHKLISNTQQYSGEFIIEEPVKFDSLKTEISRGEYHGMSVEVSIDSLEFYNLANQIITAAYNEDIDSIVEYVVLDGEDEVYRGVVDLSTCSWIRGKYASVTCKVGNIGTLTTFNNRTEVEVDLNTRKTIDGASLAHVPLWQKINIPVKHIRYTNSADQQRDYEWGWASGNQIKLIDDSQYHVCSIGLEKIRTTEFGEFNQNVYCVIGEGLDTNNLTELIESTTPIFAKNNTFDDDFGFVNSVHVEYNIDIEIKFLEDIFTRQSSAYGSSLQLAAVLQLTQPGKRPIWIIDAATGTFTNENCRTYQRLTVSGEADIDPAEALYINVWFQNLNADFDPAHPGQMIYYNNPAPYYIKVRNGSYIRMTMFDNVTSVGGQTDVILAHEALNTICESISENGLTVRSDWYGRPNSIVNQTASIGGGALKVLTNGYKIRGLYSDESNDRNMALSFKSAVESLNAIDCIGWGFSKENGMDCVRVERWNWFYKDDVVLRIDNPDKITRNVNAEEIITGLTIGFKKYVTNEQYSSIDTLHSERSFVSNIKAVSKEVQALCDFVADNYTIEEARRAGIKTDPTEESSYDEMQFIFEVGYKDGVYSVLQRMQNSTGIYKPEEYYNLRITPWYNAMRWMDFIFRTHNAQDMRFSTGTANYKSTFAIGNGSEQVIDVYEDGALHAENADIPHEQAKMLAETVEVTYPISPDEYKTIINNPYGIVVLNGEQYWISRFAYTFKEGLGEFTLIPKF